MASWPGSIPNTPLAGTFVEGLESNLSTFAPEVGPPKRRRRSSVATASVSFDLILTAVQFAALDSFYRDTLKDGALTFTMTDPRQGTSETWQFSGPISGNELGLSDERYGVTINLTRLP